MYQYTRQKILRENAKPCQRGCILLLLAIFSNCNGYSCSIVVQLHCAQHKSAGPQIIMDEAFRALAPIVPPNLLHKCATMDDLITVLSQDVPENVCALVDAALLDARKHVAPVDAMALPLTVENVALWRGDITTLDVDCIVNAANSGMLGCFTVGHKCIDNVIHARAGPRLRMECRALMKAQHNAPEATGVAKITKGYCLPARHVIHTVGPIYDAELDQSSLLTSCYTSCLDLAVRSGLHSIAFCCISTGVFGYLQAEAATIAIRAVLNWQRANRAANMRVIFNTFTARDTELYVNHPLLCRPARNMWNLAANLRKASPFMSDLMFHLWDRCNEPNSVVLRILPADDRHNDMSSLRLCGALSYMSLTHMDERLKVWPSRDAFVHLDDVIRDHEAFVKEYCTSPPQTNEVSRAASLFCGMQHIRNKMFPSVKALRLLELVWGKKLLFYKLSLLNFILGSICWIASIPRPLCLQM
jgi:O-acetyl-ADP-ribose deacetylase (regulator of RNase III)